MQHIGAAFAFMIALDRQLMQSLFVRLALPRTPIHTPSSRACFYPHCTIFNP